MDQYTTTMNNQFLNSRWIYTLLLVPVVSSVLALLHFGFVFKSGSAGAGILILLLLYFKKPQQAKDSWMVMAAFAFSIAGDWFLSHRHGDVNRFIAGIAFFFLAHIGYLFYALANGKINRKFTFLLLAAYLLFFFLKLFTSINDVVLMGAAFVYLIVSCISLGAAAGLRGNQATKWSYITGISLILFSDTIIAFKEFVGYKELNFLILPTYYLAHIAIVLSVMNRYLSGYKNEYAV